MASKVNVLDSLMLTLDVSRTVFQIFMHKAISHKTQPCLTSPVTGNTLELTDETYSVRHRN